MPRTPIGDAPMTPAERKRRQRERDRANGVTSRNGVVKPPKRDRVSELECRVDHLERLVEHLLNDKIDADTPEVVITSVQEIHQATDDEIADAYWGPHFPGHVAGYKTADKLCGLPRASVDDM